MPISHGRPRAAVQLSRPACPTKKKGRTQAVFPTHNTCPDPQVEHTESQLQLVSAALARTQDEGRASELSLQKTAQDAGAALQQMRAEAQDLRAEMAELVRQREEVAAGMEREQGEWARQQQVGFVQTSGSDLSFEDFL